jgi:predicted ATPase with chaperone activity
VPFWSVPLSVSYGDSKRLCRCSVRQIENYRQKISEPLLDRIDIHIDVPLVDFRELTSDAIIGESFSVSRERAAAAREFQVSRFKAAKLTRLKQSDVPVLRMLLGNSSGR